MKQAQTEAESFPSHHTSSLLPPCGTAAYLEYASPRSTLVFLSPWRLDLTAILTATPESGTQIMDDRTGLLCRDIVTSSPHPLILGCSCEVIWVCSMRCRGAHLPCLQSLKQCYSVKSDRPRIGNFQNELSIVEPGYRYPRLCLLSMSISNPQFPDKVRSTSSTSGRRFR
jgi:hypothetical protein